MNKSIILLFLLFFSCNGYDAVQNLQSPTSFDDPVIANDVTFIKLGTYSKLIAILFISNES